MRGALAAAFAVIGCCAIVPALAAAAAGVSLVAFGAAVAAVVAVAVLVVARRHPVRRTKQTNEVDR
jgi:membrane protein implicated in regulation of membrane protease activity